MSNVTTRGGPVAMANARARALVVPPKVRNATGGGYESRGKLFARVTVAAQDRRGVLLPWCTSKPDAIARGKALQHLVSLLRRAGEDTWIEKVLEIGAKASPDELAKLEGYVGEIVEGKIVKDEPVKVDRPRFGHSPNDGRVGSLPGSTLITSNGSRPLRTTSSGSRSISARTSATSHLSRLRVRTPTM